MSRFQKCRIQLLRNQSGHIFGDDTSMFVSSMKTNSYLGRVPVHVRLVKQDTKRTKNACTSACNSTSSRTRTCSFA